MCGIVGAIGERNAVPVLIDGLRRLEYRGYDSAGMVVVENGSLHRLRRLGKVADLAAALEEERLRGGLGIAHTRWATHGAPSEKNAHPHVAGGRVAIVHNGIVENHAKLRAELEGAGAVFESETDSETFAHLIERELSGPGTLTDAVRRAIASVEGTFALAVISSDDPERIVLARRGSPLVIGVGIDEHFAASDPAALIGVTRRFAYLEEGDVAEVRRAGFSVFDRDGNPVARVVRESDLVVGAIEKGPYRHFMQKEIFEQPEVLERTFRGRIEEGRVSRLLSGDADLGFLEDAQAIHLVACGTSFHAALVARYWIESTARIPCVVDLASEYRYRKPVVQPGTVLVAISQSGETADTLAALRHAKTLGYVATIGLCNVEQSSLVRESEHALMTRAGPEIGVASTKAFTSQLLALLLLTAVVARTRNPDAERAILDDVASLPVRVADALEMDAEIKELAQELADREHALFLGRLAMYPVALEGALKLKEISYIHAEAYAAGELKHGPLALVDENMPVIAVAPDNEWLEKVKSNLEEVKARGGRLIVFGGAGAEFASCDRNRYVAMPPAGEFAAPIVYTVPLQLLAYHVAEVRGTDVDQPRNLAKSVTVE